MPHRLNAYLASNDQLRQLSSKVERLAVLQRRFERIVPPSLKKGCRVLQLHQQVLVIAADNGAIAAKLRQMSTELITLLQKGGGEVTGIQIRVQVANPQRPGQRPPRKLGKAAQSALGELQEQLTDSPLKTALERLIRRT